MPELVEAINQVKENAKRFSGIRANDNSYTYKYFANFYHWYYFQDIGAGVFAPSKFIGYQDTALNQYRGNGSGTYTQEALGQWFSRCDRNTQTHTKLLEKLEEFASRLKRRLNQRLYDDRGGIYVLADEMTIDSQRLFPEEILSSKLLEGARSTIVVNSYERNAEARRQCLAMHGYKCRVCNMSFKEIYGEIGKHFIHVHHLVPLSDNTEEYEINPAKHLCPVCPNCHAMLHQEDPPPEILTERIRETKRKRSRNPARTGNRR